MSIKLQIILIVINIIGLSFILNLVRKNKLELKYSLLWLLFLFVTLGFSIFPSFLILVSDFVGTASPANAVFIFGFVFVFALLFALTVITSRLSKKVKILNQEIAILLNKCSKK